MAERLDIIVFGATGFTGKYTLPEVFKLTKSNGNNLSWGIAGRSQNKLEAVLAETAKRIEVDDLSWVPIIIADVNDEESIKKMTQQAKVIINCCGPYQLYGEVVVKACIESGTHMVDVSGEMQFVEGMVLKYNEACKAKGVYIISSCGVDCVPADLGVTFLENNFEGTVNSVEMYVEIGYEVMKKPVIHYGTWESAIRTLANFSELFTILKQLKTEPLPKFTPKLKARWCPLHKREDGNIWALPFVGGDKNVIQRSQRYFYFNDKKRPIQVNCYMAIDSFLTLLMFIFGTIAIFLLSQFKMGQNLLLKYPEFFTLGFCSHKDPSEETIKDSSVQFTLYGVGWDEKLAEATDQFKTPPNKLVIAKVSGKNPGYGLTCSAITLGAIMLLSEKEKIPKKGGVYSTAAAFGKTSYIKQLQEQGVKFEVVSTRKIVEV